MSRPSERDLLDALVAARVSAAVEQLDAREGPLEPATAAEIDALASLLALRDRLRPARRRRAPAIALAVTLSLASLLLFVRVPSTDIELEAQVSELRYTAPVRQQLTAVAQLSRLAIAGLASTEATGNGAPAIQTNGIFVLSAHRDGPCRGTLTLDRIVLPAGARIALQRPAIGDRLQMNLNAPGAEMQLTTEGCLVLPGGASWSSGPSQTLTLKLGADAADVELQAAPGATLAFAPLQRVEGISLQRVEQLQSDGQTLARQVSTVLGGQLYLESLGGELRRLRPAESLTWTHSAGEFRDIALGPGHLELRFSGEVSGMRSGTAPNGRSWMPTWLEWVKANHALTLLWGGVLYVFGLWGTLWRWWQGG
jgi:hypothetical protein